MSLRVREKIASLTNPALRLVFAVEKNDVGAIARELGNGADANFETRDGATLLMSAVANGQCEAAKALLEGGADPNRLSQFGNTVMDLAADASDADSVMMLLDYGALPSEKLLGRRAEALFGGARSDAAGDGPAAEEHNSEWQAERKEYEALLTRQGEKLEQLERAGAGQSAIGVSATNLKTLLDERAEEFQKEQAERKRLEAESAAQRDLIEEMATKHATERDNLQASVADHTTALQRETEDRARVEQDLSDARDQLGARSEQLEIESAARGAAERELSETKAALRAAVETKTQFLAAMGQQIQNYLGATGAAVAPEGDGEDPDDDAKVTPLRRARRGT